MRTAIIVLALAALAALGAPAAAGPKDIVIPNLVGLTRDQANAALAKAGLGDLDEATGAAEQHADEVALEDCENGTHDGTICLQYPRAGEREERGASIYVKVGEAAGEPVHVMPDLARLPLAKAQEVFAKAGFTNPLFDNPKAGCAKDVVCAQSFPAGKKVRASMTVLVWVGR